MTTKRLKSVMVMVIKFNLCNGLLDLKTVKTGVCFKHLVINNDLSIDFFVSGFHVDLEKIGFQLNVFLKSEVEALFKMKRD